MNREQSVQLVPARYVLITVASAVTGYTAKAIARKVESGVWAEGKVWRRGPDHRILIDLEGYNRWAEGQFPEV